MTGATTMIRRALLDAARPFDAAWVHDEWLAIIAASTGGVALIRKPLIGYRQHGDNVIGARKLGLRQKAGRLSESRADRNARLLARADHYLQRVEALGLPERVRSLAQGKLEHERMRSGLPAARIARFPRVLGAAVRGRYRRFGRGAMDVLRDLVQPA